MKKTIITLAFALAFLAATATSFAEVKEVKIQTSATCAMCKTRIEKSINQLDGIINANLNVDDKIATVKYDDKTTNPDKIRKAISMAGYKADDMVADAKAYKMLPDHCKGVAMIKKDAAMINKDAAATGCGTTCKDKTATEKAACCPKGCATTPKTESTTTEAKACCPGDKAKMESCKTGDMKANGCTVDKAKMENCKPGDMKGCPSSTSTVKIDGSAKIESKCDPKGCKAVCPSNKTTETAAPKVK
ncbi:MAG: heavy metal-associated domain-containing protein [bacterium]